MRVYRVYDESPNYRRLIGTYADLASAIEASHLAVWGAIIKEVWL